MPERSRQAIIQTDRGLETEKLARFRCRKRRIIRKEFNAARRKWRLLAGDGKGFLHQLTAHDEQPQGQRRRTVANLQ